jgi:hypothetical protein
MLGYMRLKLAGFALLALLAAAAVTSIGACDEDGQDIVINPPAPPPPGPPPAPPGPPAPPPPPPGGTIGAATLSGAISANRTLTADTIYTIVGFVDVQPGVTLTIQAGTTLVSDPTTRGSLITSRCEGANPSGRLIVQGTAQQPVTFGPAAGTARVRGQAGGIVLHGCAPINLPGGSGISEGSAEPFGGNNPNDSSGEIRFLRILFGGVRITPDNEINGLTLSGVGSATVIENVQAHFIADDGFEWFGGTANGRFLVASGNDDDNFDCDNGFSGTVQFFFVIQDRNLANRGIECDNDANGSQAAPVTNPNLFNATFIGAGVQQANNEVNDGLYLRRSTAGTYQNLIVANFGNSGIVLDGGDVFSRLIGSLNPRLVINNVLFFNNKSLAFPGRGTTPVTANISRRISGAYSLESVEGAFGGRFLQADPLFTSVNLDNPINGSQPDPRPLAGSPALDPSNAATPSGPGVDTSARFLGAFGSTLWIDGWTFWATS